jgi:hypothetical protein
MKFWKDLHIYLPTNPRLRQAGQAEEGGGGAPAGIPEQPAPQRNRLNFLPVVRRGALPPLNMAVVPVPPTGPGGAAPLPALPLPENAGALGADAMWQQVQDAAATPRLSAAQAAQMAAQLRDRHRRDAELRAQRQARERDLVRREGEARAELRALARREMQAVEQRLDTQEFRSNPMLGKRMDSGRKQYLFNGMPLFESYPKASEGSTHAGPSHGGTRQLIGIGKDNVVESRRNPAATVYRKSAQTVDMHPLVLRSRIEMLNQVHARLLLPDAQPFRGHFAVEIFKSADSELQPTYLTPIVHGFALKSYMQNPANYVGRLPANLLALGEELKQAMRWLANEGFVHRDIHPCNVMYDEQNARLVLIDFERVGQPSPSNSLDHDIEKLETMLHDQRLV